MKELFRRCGINQQKSLLARTILLEDLIPSLPSLITLKANQQTCLPPTPHPYLLVVSGQLQQGLKLFSGTDLIPLNPHDPLPVRSLTDCILLPLSEQSCNLYIEDMKNFKRELNQVLKDVLSVPIEELEKVRVQRYHQGERIFMEGERGKCLYVVIDGTVSMVKRMCYWDCCKYIEAHVNTNTKYTLLGEENIYNLPYRVTAKADSKVCYLLQVETKSLCKRLTVQIYLDLKFKHLKRIKVIEQLEREINELHILPVEKEKNQKEVEEISLRGLCEKSKTLKGNMSLRSFRPRQSLSYLQNQIPSLKEQDSKIDYFFDYRKERVKFELIARGFMTVSPQNYLRTSSTGSGNVTQRVNIIQTKNTREIGKQYLFPIMRKIELHRSCKKQRRTRKVDHCQSMS